jgi:hypothetical protein
VVTLAIEQVPKRQEVAHGATINLDAGKTLCPSVRAVRIWAKQVKKVGITYFSFVFTIFFSL